MSADRALGLSYFAKHDLLPRGYKLEGVGTFPTPDFQFHSASAGLTIDKSLAKHSGPAAAMSTFGWNFGANKSRSLFIVGSVPSVRNNVSLLLQDAEPTDRFANSGKTLVLLDNTFNFDFDVYEATSWNAGFGAGVVKLGTLGDSAFSSLFSQRQFTALPWTMAIYYDTAEDVVRCFIRHGLCAWVEAGAYASTKLSLIRAASILSFAEAGEMRFSCPFGLYAE